MKRYKLWALISGLLTSATLFQFGCGGLFEGPWRWVWAIAQEDLFG
jgi:hypothetical protein